MGHRSLRKSTPAKPSQGAVALFAVPGEANWMALGANRTCRDGGNDVNDPGRLDEQGAQLANATLQQEGADLIDDASALTYQPLTHAVDRLQIELLGGLCRDELHGWALDGLGDRFGVPEVILLSLGIRAHVLRRHQPRVVSEHLQLAAEMMRTHASFHAD